MWRDLALGLLVTAAFFGLLEAGARLVAPDPGPSPGKRQIFFINDNDRDRDFVVERDPDLGYRLKRTGAADTFVDSNNRAYARRKPENTFRIICLGGSTTYGTGVENSDWSYPALLEDIFRTALEGCGRRVEVINAGMMGYHSWHSRIRAQTELDALSPDLYLVMDGVNDIASLSGVESVADLERERGLLTNLIGTGPAKPGPLARLAGLLSRSALYRLAREQVARLRGKKDYADLLRAFGYRDNLAALIRGRQDKGIATVVVNYPWSVRENLDAAANLRRYPPAWDVSPETVDLYRFGRRGIAGANRQVAKATGVPLIDPQPLLDAMIERDGYYSLYADPVHFTKRGNLLLAREIYQRLVGLPPLAAFVASCRLPDLYAIDSQPLFHFLATWGDRYRGQDCQHGPAAGKIAALENVAPGREPVEGLTPLAPVDTGAGPGRIRLDLARPLEGAGEELLLYPRLCGLDDKVTIWALGDDGSRREVFSLQKTYPDGLWMPFCSRYGLSAAAAAGATHLEVELGGHTQLYAADGNVLFREKRQER
ncbi:MAG: SGNH/GDSL hydrolase family protein [Solidesulfovibrio sp. DCME]|uniref:SGNH/GDSL hydrolase family protein n=1 Tax=Solidesulfovibrio sp. DCME TaxID=3447380 RepID=UPI003D140601